MEAFVVISRFKVANKGIPAGLKLDASRTLILTFKSFAS